MNFKDVQQDINEKYNNCDKNLLLANGFTLACSNSNNLSSKNIIDKVHKYFKNRKSTRNINNVEDYIYEVEKQVVKQIYNSLPVDKIEQLKNKDKIIDFLNYFKNYYTLNYDHILYKLLLMLNDTYSTESQSTDGFKHVDKKLIWDNKNKQNTYYLHGAFHFLKQDTCIHKVKRNNNKNLYESINKEWAKGSKSHIVISPDYEAKKLKITNSEYSPYLKHCFNSFQEIEGILVTMGVSFSKSDIHIVDAIKKNVSLKKIYLGYHTNQDYKHFKELFNSDNIPFEIEYYCTKNIFDS